MFLHSLTDGLAISGVLTKEAFPDYSMLASVYFLIVISHFFIIFLISKLSE